MGAGIESFLRSTFEIYKYQCKRLCYLYEYWYLMLYLQVKGMITDFGEDMHCQFLEILRSLLDSYTLSGAQVSALVNFCSINIFLND